MISYDIEHGRGHLVLRIGFFFGTLWAFDNYFGIKKQEI